MAGGYFNNEPAGFFRGAFQRATGRKAQVKIMKLMMAEFHFAVSVQGSFDACQLTVTLSRLSGALEHNRAVVNDICLTSTNICCEKGPWEQRKHLCRFSLHTVESTPSAFFVRPLSTAIYVTLWPAELVCFMIAEKRMIYEKNLLRRYFSRQKPSITFSWH